MARQQELAEVPGPRGHWLWGSLRERRRESLHFLLRMHREYGDVVQWRMGPFNRALSLASPDHVRHVLVEHPGRYTKGSGFQRLAVVLGRGLLTSEGEYWKRHRRMAQPAFHREQVVRGAGLMVEEVERMLERWSLRADRSAPLDISEEMGRLTLCIVGRVLLSTPLLQEADRILRAIVQAQQVATRRLLTLVPAPLWVPTEDSRRLHGAVRELDRLIYGLIARRRRGETGGQDLLALLDSPEPDTGERLTDRELRDEVVSLFVAGYETTANALAWTWYLLARHPEVEARARAEVAQVLGSRPPGAEDLPRLRYVTQVLEESMRMYPPAWLITRQAREEDVVGGYRIPADKRLIIALAPWVLHHQPQWWPEPERFDPDRFLPERAAGRPRHAYMPFGAGQRHCIGSQFAMVEMVLVVSRVLQHGRLRPLPGWEVELEPLMSLRPKGGLPMLLEPRPQ